MKFLLEYAFFTAAIVAAWFLIIRPYWARIAASNGPLIERLQGWRTMATARLVALAGAVVSLHDYAAPIIGGVDWTPFASKVPAWAVPVAFAALGLLMGWLRSITTGPVKEA